MATGDMCHDNQLVKDLAIYGHQLTLQLASNLGQPGSHDLCKSLAMEVLKMWEDLMSTAKAVQSEGELQFVTEELQAEINSSRSIAPKKRCRDQDDQPEVNKKKKNLPTWTRQFKTLPGKGLEAAIEDGFTWRKYGQKAILRSTHPRAYYRCTHRFTRGCQATRKVQKSEENPDVFDVSYQGSHTCQMTQLPPKAASASPAIESCQVKLETMNNPLLQNFKANLRVETEYLEGNNPEFCSPFSLTPTGPMMADNGFICTPSPLLADPLIRTFSPFVSPAPSESNYLSSPFASENADDFLHGVEADFAEIMSTMAEASRSPTPELALEEENTADEATFDLAALFNWN